MPRSAPLGNKNAKKLTTPDIRQRAYDAYCAWIARGKSWKTFTFQEKDLCCTGKTVRKYIKESPFEFPSYKEEMAYAQGYAYWEDQVEQSARGDNEKASTASLQMLMRNKYDWDTKDKKDDSVDQKIAQISQFVTGQAAARSAAGITDPLEESEDASNE